MKQRVYIQASASYSEIQEKRPFSNRDLDRISQMCIQTVERVSAAAQIQDRNVPLFVGTAYGCLASLYEFNHVYESEGALRVNPSLFPNAVLNAPACRTGISFQIQEPMYTISNGRSSGIDTLELAYLYIAHNEIREAMVCLVEEDSQIARKIAGHSVSEGCFAFHLQTEKGKVEIKETSYVFELQEIQRDSDQQAADTMAFCTLIHEFVSDWEPKDGSSRCLCLERKRIALERVQFIECRESGGNACVQTRRSL